MDLAFFTRKAGVKIILLESCTGGLASAWITSLNGSSSWFEGGLITYSNFMKKFFLKVNEEDIQTHGAVSRKVAKEMAVALLKEPFLNIVTASITGLAGPIGGSKKKPIGLVYFSWAGPWGVDTKSKIFKGSRQQIREQAALYSLTFLTKKIAAVKQF